MNNFVKTVLAASMISLSACGGGQPAQNATDVVQGPLMLNPNEASAADLGALTEITGLSVNVVPYMLKERPFSSHVEFDQFLNRYLNAESKKVVYSKLFVPADINNAPRSSFFLIPGVNKEISFALKEGKPYDNFAAFEMAAAKHFEPAERAKLKYYVHVVPPNKFAEQEEEEEMMRQMQAGNDMNDF